VASVGSWILSVLKKMPLLLPVAADMESVVGETDPLGLSDVGSDTM